MRRKIARCAEYKTEKGAVRRADQLREMWPAEVFEVYVAHNFLWRIRVTKADGRVGIVGRK